MVKNSSLFAFAFTASQVEPLAGVQNFKGL
jgi:hypothetical protein